MHVLPARAVAAAAVLLLAACALLGGHRSLESRLDTYRYAKPLDEVWPAALRLLADPGFPLSGKDREVGGAKPQGGWDKFFSDGFATREFGPDDAGRVAETGWNKQRLRYRVEGLPVGAGGCQIRFISIKGRVEDPAVDERFRDPEMELDLLSRLDPESADRIASGEETAKAK